MKYEKAKDSEKEKTHAGLARARSNPNAAFGGPYKEFFELHHTVGNRAIGSLVQAKLKVSQPDDPLEKEADRIAGQVMRMSDSEAIPVHLMDFEKVKRQLVEVEGEENLVNTKVESRGLTEITADLEASINSIKSHGKPLPESERAFFETRLGYDLSRVRIHDGNKASELAKALDARAFTQGNDIGFGVGQYSPGTDEGRHLIAHELVHVRQQQKNLVSNRVTQRQSKSKDDPFVRRIDEMSKDPEAAWVPKHIWGLLKLYVRMGYLGEDKPHWLKRIKSGEPYWTDIVLLWQRRMEGGVYQYSIQLYKEYPTAIDYWSKVKRFEEREAARAAGAAASWNAKMWDVLSKGLLSVDEASREIRKAEWTYILYTTLGATASAAAAFYPVYK